VEAASVIIDRAIGRGELVAGTDARFALELLVAPVYARALLIRQSVGNATIEQIVDVLLRGLSCRPESPQTFNAEAIALIVETAPR
jgi:Tetracyclin repressor-like, C-terminal domain